MARTRSKASKASVPAKSTGWSKWLQWPRVALPAGVLLLAGGCATWQLTRGGCPLLGPGRLQASTHLLTLQHQAFPESGRPGVLVHIPPGFDPGAPLDVVLYFRGLGSCVEVVAASEPGRCSPRGSIRQPSHLIEQFDAARVNALLVLAEYGQSMGNTSPGALNDADGLQLLFDEAFARLEPVLRVRRTARDVRKLLVVSHSGGWNATGAVVRHEANRVQQVVLLDSFYGQLVNLALFAKKCAKGQIPGGRFVSLYTGGDPAAHSVDLGHALRAISPPGSVVMDSGGAMPTDAQWHARVLIKRVAQEHHEVTERLFGPAVATAGFTPIR